MHPISNDTVILGILFTVLGLVFYSRESNHVFFKRLYRVFPSVLVCYLLPAILVNIGLIDVSESRLYHVASRYLLPAALVLMTIGLDIKAVLQLGPKALILFFTATLGIVLGGPLALLLVGTLSPELLDLSGPEAIWRGLATIAGSWIGGGANQAAMLEVFGYSRDLYGAMVLVDIIIANLWLAILLMGSEKTQLLDRWLKADISAIERLKESTQSYQASVARIPSLKDYMMIFAVGFGAVGIAHFFAPLISGELESQFTSLSDPRNPFTSLTSEFLWMVLIATIIGIFLSKTKARSLEGAGSSKLGSVCIYLLVTTIGMQMDLRTITEHPILLLIGFLWISFHAGILLFVAKRIKAPFFFLAVGSQANVGGAASAPVIAANFHPSLGSVGILLAVLGYIVGTLAAYISALLMQAASAI